MKNTIFVVFSLIVFTASIFAQVSPNPVADAEIRDNNSIRMRELELERVKRDANKPRRGETSKLAKVRFAVIKDDFENIQKLQSSIVKAYTTGEKINYEKIRDSALEMRKKATRLGVNFFNINAETYTYKYPRNLGPISVKDLIVEIDNTLIVFVSNPMFANPTVVDAAENERAEVNLKRLIELSASLNFEAAKLAKTPN